MTQSSVEHHWGLPFAVFVGCHLTRLSKVGQVEFFDSPRSAVSSLTVGECVSLYNVQGCWSGLIHVQHLSMVVQGCISPSDFFWGVGNGQLDHRLSGGAYANWRGPWHPGHHKCPALNWFHIKKVNSKSIVASYFFLKSFDEFLFI